MLRIQDYDYHLPPELVAQYPPDKRDASRLLVVPRGGGEIQHAGFKDLGQWLEPRDLLVLNDTRVFPARLQGHKPAAAGWNCCSTTCRWRKRRKFWERGPGAEGPCPLSQTLSPNPQKGGWEGSLRGGRL